MYCCRLAYSINVCMLIICQVGKENVQTALSLVGYKSELKPAMEYVFGNSFVCSDMDTAKTVTFDERINKKSVTLDGDSFDPAGTLTGGKSCFYLAHCIFSRPYFTQYEYNWCIGVIIRLSIRPSVTLYIVIHPVAKVSEQVNRRCHLP